mmetsp:Transcript_18544/g.38923  ORF Transcript_18544/g.38923 Transcript_18544/m.38923 type:complete len:219 (-) Transcript_18544:170-826(-)
MERLSFVGFPFGVSVKVSYKSRRCLCSIRGVAAVGPSSVGFPTAPSNSHEEEEKSALLCTWSHIEDMVRRLGDEMEGSDFDAVVAITRGGLIPATLLCERKGWRNLLSATAVFYSDSGVKIFGMTEPRFLHFPEASQLDGKRVLVVDDVWDSGKTGVAVRERCRRAGAAVVKLAVLHFKPSRNVFANDGPDFYADKTDRWIMYPWETMDSENFGQKAP